MKSTGLFIPIMHPCYLKTMLISFLLAITLGTMAQNSVKHPPVTLPGSELRRFHSEIMDQDLLIQVQLPMDYVSDGSRQYPAMYWTDGNRVFPMIANIATMLEFPPGNFPQLFVVGIAYDIKDMSDFAALRTRDLTPVRRLSGDTTVETGGGPRFLSFICDELIPFIESEYPVSKEDRALGGYSLGGLFSLFAMFERPGMFQRYFAGSPTWQYANGVLFDMEKTYSENYMDLPVRLFLSYGGLEESYMSGVNEMAAVLESRNYPNLNVWTHVFEGEWHVSASAASVMRAFTTLYRE
jgi:predicted alpha/beta superfamily hydrolase